MPDAATALGDEIRALKEKLKGEGLSGKKINAHPEVVTLVGKLTAAKAEAASGAAAAPAKEAAAAPAAQEEPSAKNAEKKKAKDDAKRAKEEEKKRKEDERQAAAESKNKGPSVTLENFEEHTFGTLFIQSHKRTSRAWTALKELTPELKGQKVWIRARIMNSRKQSAKLCFLVLRANLATVQAVVFGNDIAGFAGALGDESVVDIYGTVTVPEEPVLSCSLSGMEVQVEKLFCIGRSQVLPVGLADCSRSEEEFQKDPSLARVGRDVRLDNRVIDLRTVANQAIFRMQSGVCMLFREYLTKNGFTEIHSPKIIGGASEGGSDIFKLDYFGNQACMAMSPQLYKQMALMTDLDRVFEIGPIFRAEKSFTHRHLCEFTGLDMEMTFKDHYSEVLDVLDGCFNHIFNGLNERFTAEIKAIQAQYPCTPLKYKYPCLKLTFEQAVNLLKKKGPKFIEKQIAEAKNDNEVKTFKAHLESVKNHHIEDDIGTADERIMGKIINEEYGEDFYMIDKFPIDVRPFYSMPDPDDSRWANAYDLFIRGEEITSGAQRIHSPEMLAEKATRLGIDVASIQGYIDAFKYGAYPHAGGGIGLERVVMLFMQLENIRMTSMFPRDPNRISP